jgi:hypothetical protein
MAQMEVGMNGIVGSGLPSASLDTAEGKARLGRYREQYALSLCPTKHLLAEEGSYFVASNQAPGTTVQLNANVTAFSNTNGIAHIFNKSTSGGKRIYLDYVKLILAGTAPTATVSMEFVAAIDNQNREPAAANRSLLTPVNANGDSALASISQASAYLNANAFTVAAPTAAVRMVRGHVPTGLGITGDEYILKFGGEDLGAMSGLTATRSAATARLIGYAAPLIIGPQQGCVIHMWWLTAATTAATFELEMAWWER